MTRTDAVVIGSGPNGLVAANLLADAGWDVVLLEAQDGVGGAVAQRLRGAGRLRARHVQPVLPPRGGLADDPAARPRAARARLVARPAVAGTPFADGSWALLHRTAEETAAGLDALAPGDGDAWLELCRGWDAIGDQVVGALLSPVPAGQERAGRAREGPGGGRALVPEAVAFAGPERRGPVLLRRRRQDAPRRQRRPRRHLHGRARLRDDGLDPHHDGPAGGLPRPHRRGRHAHRGDGTPLRGGRRHGPARLPRHRGRRPRRSGGRRTHRARRRGRGHPGGGRRRGGARALRRPGRLAPPPGSPAPPDGAGSSGTPARSRSTGPSTGRSPGATSSTRRRAPCTSASPSTRSALAGAQISAGAVPERPSSWSARWPPPTPPGPPRARSRCGPTATSRSRSAPTPVGRPDPRRVGPRRRRADGRPDAGPDRGVRPGFGDRVLARRLLGPREMQERDENLVGGALNGGTASLQQQLVLRPVPAWAARRPRCRGSTSARPPPTRAAGCTGPAAPTPPAPPSPTTVSGGSAPDPARPRREPP